MHVCAQVHILPVALGKAAGMAEFTYYPRMPGNTTRKPAEKRALQAEHMSPSFFEDSAVFSCQVVTLEDVMQRYSIPAIDLLKVNKLLNLHSMRVLKLPAAACNNALINGHRMWAD